MKVLITGGAGFIGSNLAARCLRRGDEVIVLDNLSRLGSRENLAWLQAQGAVEAATLDIRDREALSDLVSRHRDLGAVFHLAGQTAVTSSCADPATDLAVNAGGTLHLLLALVEAGADPVLVHASTNKVYGSLATLAVVEEDRRYRWAHAREGIDESQPLALQTPYGCSKGAADQYVLEFARSFGVRAVVLRQSCVYGERQFGLPGQGWVAWLAIAQRLGLPVTLCGSGLQVRDLLHVDDLLDAYDACVDQAGRCIGRAFNLGGGPGQTLSLLEYLELLERHGGPALALAHAPERSGDQRVYLSDHRAFTAATGWAPRIDTEGGVTRLLRWVEEQQATLRPLYAEEVCAPAPEPPALSAR